MKEPLPDQLLESIRNGLSFMAQNQAKDGSWPVDYGGPMFLLPMYISATFICKRPIDSRSRELMVSFVLHALHEEGCIGLHQEAREGTLFTTVLCYVALRILGLDPEHESLARMKAWILKAGGPEKSAPWGKWILCLLNLYDYAGIHPILPELYLLPRAFPMHPSHLWCHARQVYLPMAYLYGVKAKVDEGDLIREIRKEIYSRPYEDINFSQYKDSITKYDCLQRTSALLKLANIFSNGYEGCHLKKLREKALTQVFKHIEYEDQATNFVRLGPVNAILNTVVHYFHDPEGEAYQRSWQEVDTYLWENEAGINVQGYTSSKLWDTAFLVQATLESPVKHEYEITLRRAYDFIKSNQINEELPDHDEYFRDSRLGTWTFSDKTNGWPVFDCTAEGLKAALELESFIHDPIDEDLLQAAVHFILNFQNSDGGWATYEKKRGGDWLELFNPSYVFRDIMVDYSYVECTSACIQALMKAKTRFPGKFDLKIDQAITQGVRFIRKKQHSNGGWEGSWAVCFTYGTWFGVWGLLRGGVSPDDRAVRMACDFLTQQQRDDGGWGEDYHSCLERRYIQHEKSQVVNTAWALLTLVKAGNGQSQSAKRAADFIVSRQMENGDWPQEAMVGVFNKTTLIRYENYRRYFSIWALSAYLEANK